jgi:hypothetical protein
VKKVLEEWESPVSKASDKSKQMHWFLHLVTWSPVMTLSGAVWWCDSERNNYCRLRENTREKNKENIFTTLSRNFANIRALRNE